MESKTGRKATYLAVLLIMALAIGVYVNSLGGQFIWDDDTLIRDNEYIKHWSYLPRIFTEPMGAGSERTFKYYRPIQALSYMVDWSMWRYDVGGYHLTNAILHALVALALYWMINVLFRDRTAAFFASVLFAVHPIHTETVAYLSGRGGPLVALSTVLCFIFYVKYTDSREWKTYLLMAASCILAFLSKENAVILPLLILAYHFVFRKRIKAEAFAAVVLITAVYVLFRLTFLKGATFGAGRLSTFPVRIPGFLVAVQNYLRLMILPFDLHMEYGLGNRLFSAIGPRVLAGLALCLFLVVTAVRGRDKHRIASFAVFWFFIMLLPVSNMYPVGFWMAEHFLYIPSMGIFLVVGDALRKLDVRWKGLGTGVLVILAGFYFCLTVRQNDYWKDPISFYERTLRYAPDSSRVHYNLGNKYSEAGRYEEAVATFLKSAKLTPGNSEVYNNLAITYEKMGRKKDAIATYEEAARLEPDARIFYNLGNVYSDSGRQEDAVGAFLQAVRLKPDYAKAYNNLGVVYGLTGRDTKAEEAYKEAIGMDPEIGTAYLNLAKLHYRQKRYALAVEYCDLAAKKGAVISGAFLRMLNPHRK